MSKEEFIQRALRIIGKKMVDDDQSRAKVEAVAREICGVMNRHELSALESMAVTTAMLDAVWELAYQSFCQREQQQTPVLQ
jgi:hypothetical protein